MKPELAATEQLPSHTTVVSKDTVRIQHICIRDIEKGETLNRIQEN